jgi:hypothetical protein
MIVGMTGTGRGTVNSTWGAASSTEGRNGTAPGLGIARNGSSGATAIETTGAAPIAQDRGVATVAHTRATRVLVTKGGTAIGIKTLFVLFFLK